MINAYPYYGGQRFITAAATECNGNLTFSPHAADGHDGPKSEFVWPFQNSTGIYSLSIPRSILARASTTYIWNGTATPPLATQQTCGPRCIVLFALRDMDRGSNHEITIFQCRITISLMSNVKNPAHVLSDNMARTAAASIALSGRWRLDFSGGPDLDWRQFQLYQDGAAWATTLDDSPEDVGARMAEFAASTLATMTQQNPSTNVMGSLPTLGYQTDVQWKSTIALTVSIAATHLFMVTLIILLARPIIMVDDNYLVRVMLLKGLTRTASDGDELQLLPGAEIARQSQHSTRTEELERRRDADGFWRKICYQSRKIRMTQESYSVVIGAKARRKGAIEAIDRDLPKRVVHQAVPIAPFELRCAWCSLRRPDDGNLTHDEKINR